MDRRGVLKGAVAASLFAGVFGPEALASSELELDERLLHLEKHTGLLGARSPSPLLTRGLRMAGLSVTVFSDILSGLLFARVFKECTEEEQQDARWVPVMERIVPRFTESLAALLERTQGRSNSRGVRRMLRRPNKLARIVSHGLLGKTTARDQELRQALGALAAEPNPLGDLYEGLDASALAAGTTREELAAPSPVVQAQSGGLQGSKASDPEQSKLTVGLILLLGGGAVLVSALGLGLLSMGGLLSGVAVGLCIAALVAMAVGLVIIVVGSLQDQTGVGEGQLELSDTDLLLAADVEYLVAA